MPQYELNLRDYWQIIQRRRLTLGFIFIIIFIPTIIFTNIQKPIYQATASVQWIERRSVGSLLTELVAPSNADPLLTQTRIIKSRLILEKVVVELGLVSPKASPEDVMYAADSLQGAVSSNVIESTNIIRISVLYPDAKLVAEITNKIAEVYIRENTKERNKQNLIVREFIEKQLSEVNAKLQDSEKRLAEFKEVEVPSGVALPLQNRLAVLYTERQDLLRQFTEMHPNVKNIETEIEKVKERLKTLPQKELEYGRLNREVEINAKLYLELKSKLEAARIAESEKIEDVILAESAIPPISPVKPNKTVNYFLGAMIGLMLSITGAFLSEQMDTSIGTIEDVESYIKLPVLGVIPYLKTEQIKKRGRFWNILWPKKIKASERIDTLRKQLLVHYSEKSSIFEAYRILRTNIQMEILKEKVKGKTIAISSSGPEEGKSITIANLSVVMAQSGMRVLLIDADMRRSVIHKIFGLKSKEPGLCDVLRETVQLKDAVRTFTDVLMGDIGFDDAIKVSGLDNLSILTSGSLPGHPAELLESAEMSKLLNQAKEMYDIILLDCPPALAVADTIILVPKIDALILVYHVGKTGRALLVRTKTQLLESGAQIKGVVLNNISPQVEMRYGYYYQYKYYGKYYGGKKEET